MKYEREVAITPKTVTGVNKERYLPYQQIWEKASMSIFMYCMCKSGPKKKMEIEMNLDKGIRDKGFGIRD